MFDQFHIPIKRCEICGRYVRCKHLKQHLAECTREQHSNFGIAQMRKLHDISTSSGQKKPKIRSDLKKNTSEKESEVKMNSKLCMLTSATQANKLK